MSIVRLRLPLRRLHTPHSTSRAAVELHRKLQRLWSEGAEVSTILESLEAARPTIVPQERMSQERIQQLTNALNGLTPLQRAVLVLIRRDRMSYEEIATLTGHCRCCIQRTHHEATWTFISQSR